MTNQHRARAMAVALALCLVPLAQPAHADDDSTRSKNQKLIQSFTPYERAMYDKQQGKLGDAIAILEPMAAQGHGFEQAQLSLSALNSIAAVEAKKPGRKMLIWLSAGWPAISGPQFIPGPADHKRFFDSIVDTSAAMLKAHITLYSIDPVGMEAKLNQIVGVVTNGLFAARRADIVLVGDREL